MIDHTDLPRCSTCGGDGWIMDNEDNYTPCPDCEAEQDAMRAERDADLDAMHAARKETRELVTVEADGSVYPF